MHTKIIIKFKIITSHTHDGFDWKRSKAQSKKKITRIKTWFLHKLCRKSDIMCCDAIDITFSRVRSRVKICNYIYVRWGRLVCYLRANENQNDGKTDWNRWKTWQKEAMFVVKLSNPWWYFVRSWFFTTFSSYCIFVMITLMHVICW